MSIDGPSGAKIREYVESVKRIEDLETEVKAEIMEHLVYNQAQREKCTLRGLEREFGIPYTRLRRLMRDLTEEGVVVEGSVGNVKPYRALDLSLIFSEGYVKKPQVEAAQGTGKIAEGHGGERQPGRKKAAGDAKEDVIKEPGPWFYKLYGIQNLCLPWLVAIHGEVAGEHVFRSMPRAPLVPSSYQLYREVLDEEETRNSFDIQGEEDLLRRMEGTWPEEEIGPRRKRLQEIREKMGTSINEDRVRKLKHWGKVRGMGGAGPFMYTPVIRTNMISPPQPSVEKRLIGEYMRHTGLPMEAFTPLRHFPATNPHDIYYRDLMFELDIPKEQLSKDKILQALRQVVEKQQKLLMHMMEPMIQEIEEKGIEATLESYNTQHDVGRPSNGEESKESYTDGQREKYTPWHILFEAICLANSSYLTMMTGADEELAEKGRQLGFALAMAVERNYRGQETEGTNLLGLVNGQ